MSETTSAAPSGKHEPVRGFRELRVWQSAMDLTEDVYQLTRAFPKFETYGLSSQMQRSAISVAANIAEGHTRQHLGEYLHHLSIGRASLAELETFLELTKRLTYVAESDVISLLERCAVLGRQLIALRNSLEAKRS